MSASEPRVASCLVAAFLLGFCSSSAYGVPESRQSRSTSLSIDYLLDLSQRKGTKKKTADPPPTEPAFKIKFHMPVQLSGALETMVAHVREANNTVQRHATEAISFIGVMGSPSQLERAVTELMRELRHVWKGLRRHKHTENVKLAAVEFKRWVELVSQIVHRLKRAQTAPAVQWLHSVYLNYTLQRQAFEKLKTRTIKMVWKASLGRENDAQYINALADVIRVVSSECQGLGHLIDMQWQPSRKALSSLSQPALNLDMQLRSNSRKAKTLAMELRSSVLKPMTRDLRILAYKVKDHAPLYILLASNVVGNWQTAIMQSPHQSFLANQTSGQLEDLDSLMKRLKGLILTVTSETSSLRPLILNLLGYEDNNTSRNPPVLKEVAELANALQFFRAPPIISDGEDMVYQMLNKLRRGIKKIKNVEEQT